VTNLKNLKEPIMTMRDRVIAQINHEETDEIPYTLYIDPDPAARLDEHYGHGEWREWIENHIAGVGFLDTMVRRKLNDRDETDAFGGLWRIDREEFHLEKAPLPEPTFEGYEFPSLETFTEPAIESRDYAIELLKAEPETYRVINMGWGLFEMSWSLRGMENILMDFACEQEFVEELLDKLTELMLGFVDFWEDVPADAIFFGDDWGGQRGVLMGPDRWRQFLKPCYAKIYARTHAQGKKVISHCCGSVDTILDDAIEIGLDVLQSVQPEPAGMNPYSLKERFGDRLAFWGCLGSQSTVPFGTPDEIRAEVAKLKSEMGRGGGFILETAKSVSADVPTANAVAVLEAFTGRS
jgi:uroporphyrinogen decarboxylase